MIRTASDHVREDWHHHARARHAGNSPRRVTGITARHAAVATFPQAGIDESAAATNRRDRSSRRGIGPRIALVTLAFAAQRAGWMTAARTLPRAPCRRSDRAVGRALLVIGVSMLVGAARRPRKHTIAINWRPRAYLPEFDIQLIRHGLYGSCPVLPCSAGRGRCCSLRWWRTPSSRCPSTARTNVTCNDWSAYSITAAVSVNRSHLPTRGFLSYFSESLSSSRHLLSMPRGKSAQRRMRRLQLSQGTT